MDEVKMVKHKILPVVEQPDGKPIQIEVNNDDLWILTDKGSIYVRLIGGQWQELYVRKQGKL